MRWQEYSLRAIICLINMDIKFPSPTFLPKEKMAILDSYQRKAKITTSMLNSLEGMTCSEVTGSLYAFPRVHLPRRAIEEAKVRTSVVHVSHNIK